MFITFEGIEGCGKTTQIKRLEKTLIQRGIQVLSTLEPGGTDIGGQIRKILLDARHRRLTPLTELVLIEADRAQHVEEVIRPALQQGIWVLCDRYSDATVAYQGEARGQDRAFIRLLNERVTGGLHPDRTFLLDCPVEIGIDRALRRNERSGEKGQDRFDREELTFHRKVREAYLDLARQEPERFSVIDAGRPEDLVEADILQQVQTIMNP